MDKYSSDSREIKVEDFKKFPDYLNRSLFAISSDIREEIINIDKVLTPEERLLNSIFGDEFAVKDEAADYHIYTYLDPLKLALLNKNPAEFFIIEEIYKNYPFTFSEKLSNEFPKSQLLYGDLTYGLYKSHDCFMEISGQLECWIVRVKKYDFNSIFFHEPIDLFKKFNAIISEEISWTDGNNIVIEINPKSNYDIKYRHFDFIDLLANYWYFYLDKARLLVILNKGDELEKSITYNFKEKSAMRLKISIDILYANIPDFCINPPININKQ